MMNTLLQVYIMALILCPYLLLVTRSTKGKSCTMLLVSIFYTMDFGPHKNIVRDRMLWPLAMLTILL